MQLLKGPGRTGGIEGRICNSACQSMVFIRTSEGTTGTFWDAQDIFRYIRMQICNIICECVESVARQQKSKARCPCAFPSQGHPLLALAAGLYWSHIPMTVSYKTKIDRLCLSLTPLERETCFVVQDRIQFILHYLCAFHFALSPKAKEKQIFSPLSLSLC